MRITVRYPFIMVTVFILLTWSALVAQAQAMIHFDIPAQPLADSLRAVGSQSNTNILFDAQLVIGRQAAALKADLTTDQALSRLLAGTGIKHQFLNETTVVLATPHASPASAALSSPATENDRSKEGKKSSSDGFRVAKAGAGSTQVSAAVGPASSSDSIEEIMVTAQKRSESIQKVPVAVTALTVDNLRASRVDDVESLSTLVPGFNFGDIYGQARLNIRGIGFSNLAMGSEASVAMNINGVYLARPAAQLGSLFDIAQVEVLRGPQGTLYGRNATGGAVNIQTARPTEGWSGFARAGYGNYNDVSLEGAISGPLWQDKLLARLALNSEERNGYGKSITTGQEIDDNHSAAARLTFEFRPFDVLDVTVIGDYSRRRDHSGATHILAEGNNTGEPGTTGTRLVGLTAGGTALFDSYDTADNQKPSFRRESSGVLADINWNLGFAALRSITGYRDLDWQQITDIDGTSFPVAFITNGEKQHQISQEINLSHNGESFNWTLGAYYFHERLYGDISIPLYGGGAPGTYIQFYFAGGTIDTDASAIFGQGSYRLTDRLSATAGVRYSHERKKEVDLYTDFVNDVKFLAPYDPGQSFAAAPFPQTHSWNSFTPKFGLEYQATPVTLLYVSASKGFKSGNYNLGAASSAPGRPDQVRNPPVNPETVWAYETGLKTRVLDNRLRLNLAGFAYDYKDLQLSKVEGLSVVFTNAAAARIYGFEVEAEAAVTDRARLGLSGSWLHARFTDFKSVDALRPSLGELNLAGNTLPQAPDYAVHAYGEFTFPMGESSLTARGEVDWKDWVYFSEFNRKVISQGSYAKANTYLTYKTPWDWSVRAYAKNVFDKKTLDLAYESVSFFGYPILGFLAPPRTYGIDLMVNF